MLDKPIVGVTLGDPAGIGPEICAKAFNSDEAHAAARLILIGDAGAVKRGLKDARLAGLTINPIKKVTNAKFVRQVIDVLDLKNVPASLKVGQISRTAGQAAWQYIEKSAQLAMDGQIDAIATAPVNKVAINKAGHRFQGHTEVYAAKTGTKNFAMMFASDKLWVMLATIHIPLAEVSKQLDSKEILRKIKLAHETLYKLRGKKPCIAVAGLNPHAGEHGLFGDEDEKIIKKAVTEARALGINAKGPLSPDALFHLATIGVYDIVIAMYHDQGLIPLKLLAFDRAVNITVGLPIIRTSVDHGTAFDIAGQGIANAGSLIEAIKVAAHFVRTK